MTTRWGRELDPAGTRSPSTRGRSGDARPGAASTASGSTRSPTTPPRPTTYDGPIVVPFSPEAPLSGVGRQLRPDEWLWYRRTFTTPPVEPGGRVLLHLGAVDQSCTRPGRRRRGRRPHRRLPALHARRHRRPCGAPGRRARARRCRCATPPRPAPTRAASSGSTAARSGTPPSRASGRPSGWSGCPPPRRRPAADPGAGPRPRDGRARGAPSTWLDAPAPPTVVVSTPGTARSPGPRSGPGAPVAAAAARRAAVVARAPPPVRRDGDPRRATGSPPTPRCAPSGPAATPRVTRGCCSTGGPTPTSACSTRATGPTG